MSKDLRLTLAGIGCGTRTRTYLKLATLWPEHYKIVALADPVEGRCQQLIRELKLPSSESIQIFSQAEDLLNQPRLADVAIIGTQDHYHYPHSKLALEKGYDLLLEKPIAQKLTEAIALTDLATHLHRRISVCHVLRYSSFYKKIKSIIQQGELGDIITFNANEGVGPWRFAHAFARGYWRNMNESTPMILAKCSHDMDILYWLFEKKCEQIASFGELSYFKKETLKGQQRPLYCADWTTPVDENIDPFDARLYSKDEKHKRWLRRIYDNADQASDEEILNWLKTSPWGRDVFQCDNDQPDHQVLIMNFEGGLTGTFTYTAFEEGRHIEIYGTKARLRAGAFYKNNAVAEIIISPQFGGKERHIHLPQEESYKAHGGGDWGIMKELYHDMRQESPENMSSPIQHSLHSHVMAFAAEHARRTHQVVKLKQFEQAVRSGILNY